MCSIVRGGTLFHGGWAPSRRSNGSLPKPATDRPAEEVLGEEVPVDIVPVDKVPVDKVPAESWLIIESRATA